MASVSQRPLSKCDACLTLNTHPFGEENVACDPKYTSLFISHSSKDQRYAAALVTLLTRTIKFADYEIMCSSVPGYSIEPGTLFESAIRTSIRNAQYFIALMSPESLTSYFCAVECGAAWAQQRKRLAVVLLPGVAAQQVPRPLQSLQAVAWNDSSQWATLLSDIADNTGSAKIKPSNWPGCITELMK